MNQKHMTLFALATAAAISMGIYIVAHRGGVAVVSFALLFGVPFAWIWWPQDGRDWRGRFTKRKY